MDKEIKNQTENEEEPKTAISADLIRGHINTIILRTLYERDKYGYEIIEEIEAKSHGQYSLKQPTLYSALKRLESQGYITAYWKTDEVSNGGRRKYYKLTDSGREITEKNQNEWEYSRTVIDSLISDRNFDFTQPAPTAVDFKILKTSTSRVPLVKDEFSEEDKSREVKYDEEQKPEKTVETPQPGILEQDALPPAPQPEPQPQPVQPIIADEERLNEERRIHENYLRLVSEPAAPADDTPLNPNSEKIDTEKLIYNKKPETERDYKNLIDNLYAKTVRRGQQPQETPCAVVQSEVQRPAPVQVNYSDANEKASSDGLTVNATEYASSGRKKKYSRGSTLFKCSLIVGVIMLVEFALSLAFKDALGVTVGYPVVILALGIAQLLICGILTTTDFGKSTRKTSNLSYLTTSVVIAIIAILIIFITSLLLNVNFASAGDVMAKIIIPGFVALNIPIFSTLFYVFSK